ncbi:hypothetical protein P3T16_001389 [Paraburkholderia sp. GAS42]
MGQLNAVRRQESQKCRIVMSPEDLQKARLNESGKTWREEWTVRPVAYVPIRPLNSRAASRKAKLLQVNED